MAVTDNKKNRKVNLSCALRMSEKKILRPSQEEEANLEVLVKRLMEDQAEYKKELTCLKRRLTMVEKESKENKAEVEKLKAELSRLKESTGKCAAETAAAVKEVQEEVEKEKETWAQVARKNAEPGRVVTLREVSQLQDRRFNIIVRGVKESTEKERENRHEHDRRAIVEVAGIAGVDPKGFKEAVVQCRRIGKWEEGKNFRPLLVKLRSQDFREDVLRGHRHTALKSHNKEHATRFRLDPDLSKEQKAELDKLYEEARSKSKNGVQYYVIGRENPVLRSREKTAQE